MNFHGLRYYRHAQDLLAQGKCNEALGLLERAERSSPGQPSVEALRLYALWRLGHVTHHRAVEFLGAAGSRGGRSGAQALHLLGRVYLTNDRSDAAQECYWLAHQCRPNRTESSASATALAMTGNGWDLLDLNDSDFIENDFIENDFIEEACEGSRAA
jgi:tetratricopeptide (TPR) repeat protein